MQINNSFSLVPWTSLYIRADGNMYPCESVAWSGEYKYCAGNIATCTFEDAWNSSAYRDMRLEVLNTQRCAVEDELEIACTYLQHRHLYNQDINFYKEHTTKDGKFYFNLQRLVIERSNICNLSCVYCNATSSTSWAKKLKQPTTQRISDKIYWKNIDPILPTLIEGNISGGEPVLDIFNEKLLDKLIDAKNFIELSMATNVTYDLNKKASFFEKFAKFKSKLFCSVDTKGKAFEIIRENSNWDLVFANLKQLKTYNIDLLFCISISILNCFSLKEFHQFLIENNLAAIDSIRYQPVLHPTYLSIQTLSVKKKEELRRYLLRYVMYLKAAEKNKNINVWCNNKATSEAILNIITKILFDRDGNEQYTNILNQHININAEEISSLNLN